jgi:hypothetical protein
MARFFIKERHNLTLIGLSSKIRCVKLYFESFTLSPARSPNWEQRLRYRVSCSDMVTDEHGEVVWHGRMQCTERILPQCRFVRCKPRIDSLGTEPACEWWDVNILSPQLLRVDLLTRRFTHGATMGAPLWCWDCLFVHLESHTVSKVSYNC